MTNHLYDALFSPRVEDDRCLFSRPDHPDMSYRAFLALAAQMAHCLVDLGLKPGDRVAVQAPKTVEMVALYVATIQAGGVFLPLNTTYQFAEVAYFLEDASPRIVVADPNADEVAGIATRIGAHALTLDCHGHGTLRARVEGKPITFDSMSRGPTDLAALLYTSGTTGRSKGAMLSHQNLLSNTVTLTEAWAITDKDVLLHALPIFHTHGLFVALNTSVLAGARVHFLPNFNLDATIEALPESTVMMGVPTFYTRLLGDPRLTRDKTANMRLFISGSAPLLTETHKAFTERTGHCILERYGMTETNMNTSNPYVGERRAGTVGPALPGVELRLTDPETGLEVAPGAVGIVEVRGENVFLGYWQMPDKTSAELRQNGFFITGDLGQLGSDGYLSIVGRAKDLIITGGLNVYPKEIEEVLNACDGVAESAVFGIEHADFGEAVVAAIVPDAPHTVVVEACRARVATQLARFKQPTRYEIVTELPRNAMGKVQKTMLKKMFSGPA